MERFVCNADSIRQFPILSSLTASQLDELMPSLQHRTYGTRSHVLRAGDKPEGLYLIMSGRVNLLLEDPQGRQIIVAVRGPNDFFGETHLFEPGRPGLQAECVERTELCFVPYDAVLEALRSNTEAAMLMLKQMAGQLAEAQHKIGELGLLDVYGRVAAVLIEHAREVDGQWLVETGSERIAATVGASREMVSRVVKNMIGKGAVRRYKRKLIVLDRAALTLRSQARPKLDGGKTNLLGERLVGARSSAKATRSLEPQR